MTRPKKNVVVIGGGTGSSIVIRALKGFDIDLSTIVPMGDSGGSTGKLRDEFGVSSVGEIRERLIAMASDDAPKELLDILGYRFKGGKELKGHNLGNLLVAAFSEMYRSQMKAVGVLSKLLKIRGEITPSTWDRFDLAAEYEDGSIVKGEHHIDEPELDKRIQRLFTEPEVKANPEALRVIENADYIIFAPGDLYTSVLHSLVVGGLPQAVSKSRATKIYVANFVTSRGETTGMSLGDHVAEIEKYASSQLDYIISNSKGVPAKFIELYKSAGQELVDPKLSSEQSARIKVIEGDFLANEEYKKSESDLLERSLLRYDAKKLEDAFMKIIKL